MSKLSNIKQVRASEAGFSLLQMLVAIAIIAIVSNFGFIAISRAKKDLALSGEIRQFSGYLEKGRIEATRRHTSVTVITINSSSSYTVTLDSNYDGTVSATESRIVTLPTGVTFNSANITYPATISYNLQGRSSTTNITGSTLTMSNANGTTTNVTMTGGGDLTLDSTVTGPSANTSLAPTTTVLSNANIKSLY
jgi:Tfp pilus assembly protein FimT